MTMQSSRPSCVVCYNIQYHNGNGFAVTLQGMCRMGLRQRMTMNDDFGDHAHFLDDRQGNKERYLSKDGHVAFVQLDDGCWEYWVYPDEVDGDIVNADSAPCKKVGTFGDVAEAFGMFRAIEQATADDFRPKR